MYKYHNNINKNHNFWKQKPYKSMSALLFLQKNYISLPLEQLAKLHGDLARTCSFVPLGTEMAEDTRLTWRVRGYHFVTLLIRSALYKALLSAF